MKYLAIFKDSFREALDSKVLYVMIGLSAVLILLVVTTSFDPLDLEQDLDEMTGDINRMLSGQMRQKGQRAAVVPQLPKLDFTLGDFNQSDADAPPWRQTYRFNLEVQIPDRQLADFLTTSTMRSILSLRYEQMQQIRLKELELTRTESQDGKKLTFHVKMTSAVTSARGWPHYVALFSAIRIPFAFPLGFEVYFIEAGIVTGIGGWITLIVAVVITAFFIPNMLHKGTLDLLLVKPIHRPVLLVLKYLGGLSFMFVCSTAAVGGVWLMLGLRTGIWDAGFLLTILTMTFFFAILYALSTLFAVLTRSAVVAIMMTLGLWFVFFLVGQIHALLHNVFEERDVPGWAFAVVDSLHAVLPRTSDLNALTSRMLATQAMAEDLTPEVRNALDQVTSNWGETVGVSLGFIVVMLGLSCWRFSTKDY